MTEKLNLKLYYFPGSFYSQKAFIALHEKGLPFDEHIISLLTCDQLKPSFLKINPKGEIPVLQHGDKTIAGSCEIMDYLEETFGDAPRLLPPPGTPEHKTCKLFSEKLAGINVFLVSFGTLQHPELRENCQFPGFIVNRASEYLNEKLEKADKTKAENPDLKDVCDTIRSNKQRNIETTRDKKQVLAVLDETDKILSDVEKQLTEVENRSGCQSHWLCGDQFTVADIHLGTLLIRLHGLGLSNRFWLKADGRSHLKAYFARVSQRASFKKVVAAQGVLMFIKGKLPQAAPYIAAIVIGLLGIAIGYRYLK